MNLEFQKVRGFTKEIKQLYLEAFPIEERMPYYMLRFFSKSMSDFYCLKDNNQFVGMMYNVIKNDVMYIFYFAIKSDLRGKGYGKAALKKIQEMYPDKRVVLSIEKVDQSFDNYTQRLNRKGFYESCGFTGLGIIVKEGSVEYELMSWSQSGKHVSKEEYQDLLKSYFGTWMFKLLIH